MTSEFRIRLTTLVSAALLAAGLAACAAKQDTLPVGTREPDKFLYERGTESLEKKRWMSAREYFRRIIDGYPQSEVRPDS